MKEEFYSKSLDEQLILDRSVYRGKGRPRKEDYITLKEAMKKYNKLLNDYLDLKIKQIYLL